METKLPPDLDHFVREEVASGRFADAAEVVAEALRRLRDEQAERVRKRAALVALLQEGIDDFERHGPDPEPVEAAIAAFRARRGL
jgi:putative addiction module CopG family antidote